MMSVEVFVVLAPLVASIIAGVFQRQLGNKIAMAITTGVLILSAIGAWMVFWPFAFGHGEARTTILAPWINVGDFKSDWAIRIDALSAVMLVVVTTVSALVHVYSVGYMEEDPDQARFFAYLSFFTFAMLALVTANDFMQLFFGWEGVGVASYLLIGFWFKKRSANDAQIKAFVVNRVGDFGFALGIMAVFVLFGSVKFDEVFPLVASKANVMWTFAGMHVNALETAAILLFIGAMGKSAQFFLHTWLPDAMEGPTPVSALIHAATMVTAGVVLVCRCSYIYEYTPIAAGVITIIGAVTALFAATVGLAQNDIKRVIAYSTCSQLGYMFFAAGIGAYQAAMFHLFTHAFFKALLFLGAGSVIHGLHHEQDMRKMGAVAKPMMITYAVMLIGTLAITGVGIPGTHFGFAGFFSKDAIIETTFMAGAKGDLAGQMAFAFAIVAALLTSFYSWRLIFMTFHGTYKGEAHAHHHDDHHTHDDHGHAPVPAHAAANETIMLDTADRHGAIALHEHAEPSKSVAPAHESPLIMLVPLFILAAGALFAGAVFYDAFVGHHYKEFWGSSIFTAPDNTVLKDKYDVPKWVLFAPLVVTIIGFLSAVFFYLLNEGLGAKIAARKGPLHSFLQNKWFFDELYEVVFVKGARAIGDIFWKVGDKKIIDGLGPDGVAGFLAGSAKRAVKLQSGYVYHYAFVMLGAVVAFGAYILFAGGVK